MGSFSRQVGRARRRRRQQAVLECATGVVTAAAAGLFAQPLGYIYPGRGARRGAAFGPLPARGALVSTAAGAGRAPLASPSAENPDLLLMNSFHIPRG